MKQLLFLGMAAVMMLTACGQRDSSPDQGTRPVGDAGGTDQVYGTNAVNDPAGAATGTRTNTQPNR